MKSITALKEILLALQEVFLSYTPERSFTQSMIKFDFKLGSERSNLMQLCFSNLAAWPLFFILLLIRLDPFRRAWHLVDFLSFDHPVMLFLLNGQLLNMLSFFFIFFIAEWLIKKEYLLIAIVFYFINRSEIHIHLATASILAIYLSRLCYLSLLVAQPASLTQQIWSAVGRLQLLAWGLVALTTFKVLDFIQVHFLFNETSELNRFNFLIVVILLYHGFCHLFLSLWGHFYILKKREPTFLPVYYSTGDWVLKFNKDDKFNKTNKKLLSALRDKTTEQLQKHQESRKQLQELQKQNVGLQRLPIEKVLNQEIENLKQAELHLAKIKG